MNWNSSVPNDTCAKKIMSRDLNWNYDSGIILMRKLMIILIFK